MQEKKLQSGLFELVAYAILKEFEICWEMVIVDFLPEICFKYLLWSLKIEPIYIEHIPCTHQLIINT
jgi:hypothetical protein